MYFAIFGVTFAISFLINYAFLLVYILAVITVAYPLGEYFIKKKAVTLVNYSPGRAILGKQLTTRRGQALIVDQ